MANKLHPTLKNKVKRCELTRNERVLNSPLSLFSVFSLSLSLARARLLLPACSRVPLDELPTTRSVNVKGWLMMAATLTVAGASVAAASFYGGKRAGGVVAATEAVVLASRVRKAIVMRRVETGRKS